MLDDHLISISDRLVQLDPRELTDRQDVIDLVEAFGFTDSVSDIPRPWRHILSQANRLGLFRDENGEYWLARAQRNNRIIDISHIGSFNTLRTQWQQLDLSIINESDAYRTLINALEAYAIELKYDNSGVYQRLYLRAEALLDQLEREEIDSRDRFLDALSECCRQFWQVEVELQQFSTELHGQLLPQTFRMDEPGQYIAVQDSKIVWITYKHEAQEAWDKALTYETFRKTCSELAAWARNASF